jgi:hypothetical protein
LLKHSEVLAPSLLLVVLALLLQPDRGEVGVLTQHNDNNRTGANLNETVLNTSNVNANQFGKLFSRSVDGQIYAQPLCVPNVSIPNQGTHNVVYVATMHNGVYAFDADDPEASAPLWRVNLGPSVPWQDTATLYPDINSEVGITSTPVIDVPSKTLYLVAKTKENNSYIQRLHALDIATGMEKPGSPVLIQASLTGSGDGSLNGTISLDPLKQLNRPGLLLLDDVVYIAFGSHGDVDPYHGWVLGYSATTLQQVTAYNTTRTGTRAGIWQGGQGLAADASGHIYLMTGNGTFDYNTGGANLGNSFVKLATPGGLSVVDWFTPHNQDYLNEYDLDLGSTGPVLLPGTSLLLGGGKEGVLYLLDARNMGHFQVGSDSQIVQSFKVTTGLIYGSPVYWNSPDHGPLVYIWGENDSLKAFQLVNGRLQTTPLATSTMTLPNGRPGGMLSLSANGNTAGSGIVWASHPLNASAHHATVAGILRAFDASDVSKELWNSKQDPICNDSGSFAKFCPPTVANGKVYLATFSNQLVVYGLRNGAPPPTSFTAAVFSAEGLNNSFFTSELTLTNRGSSDATLDFTYTPAFGDGSGSASDTLPTGQQRIIPDALLYLKSLGIPIPNSGSRGGTLAVRFSNLTSCSDGAVTVRTTTAVAGGRAGLAYAGIPTSLGLNGPSYLCGLRHNSKDRSNVAIQNVGLESDGNIWLRLTVLSGDPAAPFQQVLPEQELSPGGFRQFSGILQASGLSLTNGYVRVERVSGTAPYYAYAVINANRNSDGSFIPPIPESALAGRPGLVLPVMLETNSYTSELVLTNWSTTPKTVRFAFVADVIEAPDNTANFVMALKPGEQSILENVIQQLRTQGVPGIGTVGPAYAGPLFATVDGEDASGLSLGARTSTTVGDGPFGTFSAGVPYGTASETSAWLCGLQQNDQNRTNLALVNTGEMGGGTDVFNIELFDGNTGRMVSAIEGISLQARSWKQFGAILAQHAPGITQGYAHVTRTAGSNPFITYAVINDGAQLGRRSDDGAFVSSVP